MKEKPDTLSERIRRLYAICQSIQNESVQVADLAESTGKTERTIKRDLDLLREEFGAPLKFDRKAGKFIFTEQWDLLDAISESK